MSKVSKITEMVSVNSETGEVLHKNVVTEFRLPKEPSYVKLYLDDLGQVLKLAPGSKNLLHELAFRLDYEGYVSLSAVTRERICNNLNIKPQTLKNYLQDLKKTGFLLPVGTNCFKINPNYFAKGDWHNVFKQRKEYAGMELRIRYNADGGREISSSVIEPENKDD